MKNNNYNQNNNTENKSPRTEGEFTDVMIRDTAKFQEKYGFEVSSNGSAWNNESDAFRHAYMQAYLTLRYSNFVAELLGNYHERDGNKNNNQDKAEEHMDQHNNKIGREIGNEIIKENSGNKQNPDNPEIKEIIARKVVKRMQLGELILDPSGRRTPKEKLNIPKDTKSQKQSKSQKGCVGSYPVSGYTRADGKEVKGYTRTCGAKHLSSNKNNNSNFAPEKQKTKQNEKEGCFGNSDIVISKKDRQIILEKYKNRQIQDLSKEEINEFLDMYFI